MMFEFNKHVPDTSVCIVSQYPLTDDGYCCINQKSYKKIYNELLNLPE